jgi:hypothetical protein
MMRARPLGRAGVVPRGRRTRNGWKAAGLESRGGRTRRRAACSNGYAVVTRGAARGPPWLPPGMMEAARSDSGEDE